MPVYLDGIAQREGCLLREAGNPLVHEGSRYVVRSSGAERSFKPVPSSGSGDEFRRAASLQDPDCSARSRGFEVGLASGYEAPMGGRNARPHPKGSIMKCGVAQSGAPYCRARHHRWCVVPEPTEGAFSWTGSAITTTLLIGDSERIRVAPNVSEKPRDGFLQKPNFTTPPGITRSNASTKNGVVTSIAIRIPGHQIHRRRWLGPCHPRKTNRFRPAVVEARFFTRRTELERSRDNANFIDCVKSRATCGAPCDTAHRSITPGHLGYVSHRLQRPLKWDAVQQRSLATTKPIAFCAKGTYRSHELGRSVKPDTAVRSSSLDSSWRPAVNARLLFARRVVVPSLHSRLPTVSTIVIARWRRTRNFFVGGTPRSLRLASHPVFRLTRSMI